MSVFYKGQCKLILKDGSVFENVAIEIELVPPKPQGGLKSWHGVIEVPEGTTPFRLSLTEGTADIETDEGLRGSIIFRQPLDGAVTFLGTGPLS